MEGAAGLQTQERQRSRSRRLCILKTAKQVQALGLIACVLLLVERGSCTERTGESWHG